MQVATDQGTLVATSLGGAVYQRRRPETTVLYQVLQEHLAEFEQKWSMAEEGRTLPKFVLDELRGYLECGVLGRGFAVLFCDACKERHLLAFCCRGRGFCPCCLGRRMNEGALNLVDHVLPEEVPVRQWVVTMPYPLRLPLAFEGKLLTAVLRIFYDTVAGWYRRRLAELGVEDGQFGAVCVIQRAASDLRLNPHLHLLALDGVYAPADDGSLEFHQVPRPTTEDIEAVANRAALRIVRYLERRGVISKVVAPGYDEAEVAIDEALCESDPLLATLLGEATRHRSERRGQGIEFMAPRASQAKGNLCAEAMGFNVHAATRVAARDRQGRTALCRYVLRPPFAQERLELLPDGKVRLRFKRPWKNGRQSVELEPTTFIARLAALVPFPRQHTVRYLGLLSSHSRLRSLVTPGDKEEKDQANPQGAPRHIGRRCTYIPWLVLRRRTFKQDVLCPRCGGRLRLLSLVKKEETITKILGAMGLDLEVPKPRPPPAQPDWQLTPEHHWPS